MRANHTDTMRRTATIAIAALVMLSFIGVGAMGVGASQSESESAQVRIVHLSPDAPAVDVLVDGQVALEGVEFGNVSDYLDVPAGERQITVQAAENDTVVFEGNVTVEAGTNYTAVAVGEVSEETFGPAIYVDDFETPGEENASVRLIHASPDAPPVDVTVAGSGAVLYDNVTFGNASDYATVPAGDYTLEVRPATADDDGDVVTTFNVSLSGGTVYSAMAAGYLTPDDEPADVPFDLIVAVDAGGAMMGEETETMGEQTETEMMDEETETETMETATPE